MSELISQNRFRYFQFPNVWLALICPTLPSAHKKVQFMLSATVVTLSCCACTPSSSITVVPCPINCAVWGHIVFSDKSLFQLGPTDNCRRCLRPALTIASHQAHDKALFSEVSSPMIAHHVVISETVTYNDTTFYNGLC